jgi:hypothetical protein
LLHGSVVLVVFKVLLSLTREDFWAAVGAVVLH